MNKYCTNGVKHIPDHTLRKLAHAAKLTEIEEREKIKFIKITLECYECIDELTNAFVCWVSATHTIMVSIVREFVVSLHFKWGK